MGTRKQAILRRELSIIIETCVRSLGMLQQFHNEMKKMCVDRGYHGNCG